ncbi:MAG TPA: hypothetical protein VIG24_01340 [Acidimicrobiia bacterium]
MIFLAITEILFWVVAIGGTIGGLAYVGHVEALDRHQERLAAQHRAKRHAARNR